MGFNTTVVILNDSLHMIAQDKGFGKRLADAITLHPGDGVVVDVAAVSEDGRSCHVNAAQVIETHHADMDRIIRVGGNTGECLGSAYEVLGDA